MHDAWLYSSATTNEKQLSLQAVVRNDSEINAFIMT